MRNGTYVQYFVYNEDFIQNALQFFQSVIKVAATIAASGGFTVLYLCCGSNHYSTVSD